MSGIASNTKLGKILSATFGFGGYQDCMIGFWLSFGGDGWEVSGSDGCAWSCERSDSAKWTEADRVKELATAAMKLADTLEKAKKRQVQDLVAVPVLLTFDGNLLTDWRILTEVL